MALPTSDDIALIEDKATTTTTTTSTSTSDDSTSDFSEYSPENDPRQQDTESESGIAGGGEESVDLISPDPNENTDGDAVVVDDQGNTGLDTSKLEDEDSVDEIRQTVADTIGDPSNQSSDTASAPAVDDQTLALAGAAALAYMVMR